VTYVVSSDAEVATLPPGTILRDAEGHAWYRGTGSWVSAGGDGPPYDPEWRMWQGNLLFPALVLWHGSGGTRPTVEEYMSWSLDTYADLSDEPMVCTTHKRFIPCRFDESECAFSTERVDVKVVSDYQHGR